jgi:hypothetical protein
MAAMAAMAAMAGVFVVGGRNGGGERIYDQNCSVP